MTTLDDMVPNLRLQLICHPNEAIVVADALKLYHDISLGQRGEDLRAALGRLVLGYRIIGGQTGAHDTSCRMLTTVKEWVSENVTHEMILKLTEGNKP